MDHVLNGDAALSAGFRPRSATGRRAGEFRAAGRPTGGLRVGGFWADDRGAATAEFAVVTMAAVGFAGLLVVILRSDEVRGILTNLVRDALTVGF